MSDHTERGIHSDRDQSEQPWWPAGAVQKARTARETAETHPDKGEALGGAQSGEERCDHTILDREGDPQPCDRPVSDWRWYEDGGDGPLLARVCALHGNAGGREVARLRAERDSLRAALDDRNRLWGHRSRELGDLRAEVERLRSDIRKVNLAAAAEGRARDKAEAERDRYKGDAKHLFEVALEQKKRANRLAGVVERVRALADEWGSQSLLDVLDADAPEASEEGQA